MKEEAALFAGICVIVLYLWAFWWLNDMPTMWPLGEVVSEYSIFGIWKRYLLEITQHMAPDVPSYSSYMSTEEIKRIEYRIYLFQLGYDIPLVIYWTIVDLFMNCFFTELGYATRPLAIIYLFLYFYVRFPFNLKSFY